MKTTLILTTSIFLAFGLIIAAFVFLKPKEVVNLPVPIEEYMDFNCIHCKNFQEVSTKIKADFGTKINMTAYPIAILGSSSEQAAYAHQAAVVQGKGEEYFKVLFENMDKRTDTDYQTFAKNLGLNIELFNKDRESTKIQDLVKANQAQANNRNITSTPTIFVNGKIVANWEYENLKTVIQDKINLAEKNAKN